MKYIFRGRSRWHRHSPARKYGFAFLISAAMVTFSAAQSEPSEVKIRRPVVFQPYGEALPTTGPFDAAISHAETAINQKRYPYALWILKRLVSLDPNSIRARLRLAEAYGLSGAYWSAKIQYLRLAGRTRSVVAQRAFRSQASAMAVRQQVEGSISFAIIPPETATFKSQLVSINGLPLPFRRQVGVDRGYGLNTNIGLNYRINAGQPDHAIISVFSGVKDFSENSHDEYSLKVRANLVRDSGKWKNDIYFWQARRWVDRKQYSRSGGGGLSALLRLNGSRELSLDSYMSVYRYPGSSDYDAVVLGSYVGWKWPVTGELSMKVRASMSYTDAGKSHLDFYSQGASLQGTWQGPWRLRFRSHLSATHRSYRAPTILGPHSRRDFEIGIGAEISKRDWSLFGVVPTLVIQSDVIESNIPIYSGQSMSVMATFTRSF